MARVRTRISYEYDFGDGWEHELVVAGPPGEEQAEMLEWAGEDYDPARFDLAAANVAVAAV